jgi:hypothetical protein
MRKLLRMTILVGLMVLFGAAEDGMVFGIGSAQAPNWPTPDAHVVRRCRPPYHPPRLQARLLRRLLPLLTERRVTSPIAEIPQLGAGTTSVSVNRRRMMELLAASAPDNLEFRA